MSDDIVPERPTAVKIGIVTAIVLGILFLLAIPFSPLNVIPVLVFLAIALGLWRGSRWSGYGGALFIVARWVGELLALARFSAPSVPWASWALATVLVGCVAYLCSGPGGLYRGTDGAGRDGDGSHWQPSVSWLRRFSEPS
jgi:hypothetical protein